ncbi:MAG: two-component regulator propeller domain-containing protein, partial [Calditrichia bacterium]
MLKSFLVLSAILISFVLTPLSAANFDWEIVTNPNDIREIEIRQDTIWAATTGGLLAYPLNGGESRIWNAENGITDHQFTAMAFSPRGLLALGTQNGNIAFLELKSGRLLNDDNLQGYEITAITAVGDTLWVATTSSIAVYLYNAGKEAFQFRDNYNNFEQQIDRFYDLVYWKNRIWAASDKGLFAAPGNFLSVNLKSAGNWTVYTTDDGLPINRIYSLETHNNQLLVGAHNGLAIFDGAQFQVVFQGLTNREIHEIQIYNDEIYIENTAAVFRLQQDQFQEVAAVSPARITAFAISENGHIWAALQDRGLRNLSDGQRVYLNGIIDNNVGESLLDSRGRLWVLSGGFKDERNIGFSVRLNDGEWRNFKYLPPWHPTNSAQTILEDAAGNIWIGSWNGGLVIITPDFKFYHFTNYTTEGKLWTASASEQDTLIFPPADSLRHFFSYTIGNAVDLLVVTDLMMDRDGQSIWMSLAAVQNEKPLVKFPFPEFNDEAFDSTTWKKYELPDQLGIEGTPLADLTTDIFGNIWIGTERNGVISMQISAQGDTSWMRLQESDNLKNNNVFTVAGDQDGYVWLGTAGGLNAWFNGNLYDFREDYQPIGLRINDIFVDSENNKWFATNKGLSLLRSSG